MLDVCVCVMGLLSLQVKRSRKLILFLENETNTSKRLDVTGCKPHLEPGIVHIWQNR